MTKESLSVNTVEAKNRLNELINTARESGQPVIVQKRGESVAVILDYETYKQGMSTSKAKQDKTLFEELVAFHKTLKKKYPKTAADSVQILSEIRKDRSER